jgi:hypothetical protein
MFTRDSRYRSVPEVSRLDPDGRTLLVKDLRVRPEVSGTFRHTVSDTDRLDHLAQTYYRKPRNWWRISDANPAFPSPLAMLGQDPVQTVRIHILSAGVAIPAWPALLAALRAVAGVEDVTLAFESRTAGAVEVEERAVTVTFNRMNVEPASLVQTCLAAGFPAGPPAGVGRVGKQIVVPPEGIR